MKGFLIKVIKKEDGYESKCLDVPDITGYGETIETARYACVWGLHLEGYDGTPVQFIPEGGMPIWYTAKENR